MEAGEIVDAQAVEDEPGQELVVAESQTPATLFHTNDPVEVIERATAVADALKDVLKQQGLTTRIRDKDHVNVEGWQVLGAMVGVFPVVTTVEEVQDGYKAYCEARTLAGAVVGGGEGLCLKTEKRGPWKSAEQYAIKSMAQTRAISKAMKAALGFLVSMAGYSATPAEEMGGQTEFPFGEPAPVETQRKMAEALAFLIEPDAAATVWEQIARDCNGYIPRQVARAILMAAAGLKASNGNDITEEDVDGSSDGSEPGSTGDDDDRYAEGGVE